MDPNVTMVAGINVASAPAGIADNKLVIPPTVQFIQSPTLKGRVKVRLIGCRNLIAADVCGTSDPYVKLKAASLESIKVTKVIEKTLNPIWNEEITVEIKNVATELLIVDVYDKDKVGNDDLIGYVGIDLAVLPLGIEVLTDENLSFVKHGSIQLGITALDFGASNIPQNYMQVYTQWRNGLPAYQRKEFSKLKKSSSHGCYHGKSVHHDYKNVKGYLKRKKNKREKTSKGIFKGLKKAGKFLADNVEIEVGEGGDE